MSNRTRKSRPEPSLQSTFQQAKTDYAAAKTSRFRRRRVGIASQGSGADYHYRVESDWLRMIEYARDMDRNDSILGQGVDRAKLNTVQNGFTVDPDTSDTGLNTHLYERMEEWGSDPQLCDAAGELTFVEQQELVFRQTLVDGDHFANPLQEGQLELIESHRCRTPSRTQRNVVHGILMDDQRRRAEYWFTKEDVNPNTAVVNVNEMRRMPAFDEEGQPSLFHIFDPRRTSQTRGITAFAPIFDVIGMRDDIGFAKLVQQQIVSCVTFMRQRPPVFDGNTLPAPTGERTQQQQSDGSTRIIDGIAPGMELIGEPGEQISGFSPNVPNSEFFSHVKLMITEVGANIGLPYVMMMMDAADTNFSGWRGAIEQARMGFRRNQRWLRDRFHSKVYRWKVRQWIAEDPQLQAQYKKLKDRIFKHKWNTPRWPYIQPLQDAQADQLRVKALLTSPRRIQNERGQDVDEIVDETIADNGRAIRNAIIESKKIFAEQEVQVDWREILFLTERELITTLPLNQPEPAPADPTKSGGNGA